MSLQIVTANRLRDGLVVFLAEGGKWSGDIDAATIAVSKESAEVLLSQAAGSEEANVVVAPYLVEVEHEGDGLRPVRYREWLRTQGPTVRTDLGYQAAGTATRSAA